MTYLRRAGRWELVELRVSRPILKMFSLIQPVFLCSEDCQAVSGRWPSAKCVLSDVRDGMMNHFPREAGRRQ